MEEEEEEEKMEEEKKEEKKPFFIAAPRSNAAGCLFTPALALPPATTAILNDLLAL